MPIYSGNQKSLHWTGHAKSKMNFYRLSEARVKRVLNSPRRIERGVAADTIAMMQPQSVKNKTEGGKRKEIWTQEIWVMVEHNAEIRGRKARKDAEKNKSTVNSQELKIISVWRYPGMTKVGEPLPQEILNEMREEI